MIKSVTSIGTIFALCFFMVTLSVKAQMNEQVNVNESQELIQTSSVQTSVAQSSSVQTRSTQTQTMTTAPTSNNALFVRGTLSFVGSETLSGMLTRWAQEFEQVYPQVNIQVQTSGSSSAPTALIQGSAQFGAMSRPMTEQEFNAFVDKYGYEPTQVTVAMDAVGIFAHQDNPIKGLNLTQLDGIFSQTFSCGAGEAISHWSDLNINTPWSRSAIQKIGRNSISGTYRYVKQYMLCGGEFDVKVHEMLGGSSVVEAVAQAVDSIGYSGVGDKVAGTRIVPIAFENQDYVMPTMQTIASGRYPLTRRLYIYFNQAPNTQGKSSLSQVQIEWLKFIFSAQGQDIVKAEGYVPLSAERVAFELSKVF